MKSVSLILLVVFITLSTTSAKHLYEPRIFYGQDATEGQFPYMASLRTRANGHFCGASILSNRFLLTAAHCCQYNLGVPKNIFAVVGTIRQSSGGVKVELDTVTVHEKFDLLEFATREYDIAVLRTAADITFTDLIQPIALPKANLPEDQSVKLVFSGWGEYTPSSLKTLDILQYTEVSTISITECAKRYENAAFGKYILKGNVCTVDSKHSRMCSGDSGSGLVDATDPNHKTVVGIAAWNQYCREEYPDVFTRVYAHLEWINEHIEKQSVDL